MLFNCCDQYDLLGMLMGSFQLSYPLTEASILQFQESQKLFVLYCKILCHVFLQPLLCYFACLCRVSCVQVYGFLKMNNSDGDGF
jgi:hypothetical protein